MILLLYSSYLENLPQLFLSWILFTYIISFTPPNSDTIYEDFFSFKWLTSQFSWKLKFNRISNKKKLNLKRNLALNPLLNSSLFQKTSADFLKQKFADFFPSKQKKKSIFFSSKVWVEPLTFFIGPGFLLPSSNPLHCLTWLRANTELGGSAMFTVGFHLQEGNNGSLTPTLACFSKHPGNPVN